MSGLVWTQRGKDLGFILGVLGGVAGVWVSIIAASALGGLL